VGTNQEPDEQETDEHLFVVTVRHVDKNRHFSESGRWPASVVVQG